MGKHIALLRGINVGKAKRVPMADLSALFSGLGYRDVKTLLNSGNVVFSAAKAVESKIEAAFTERFGFSSRITLVGAEEFSGIVKDNPIAEIPDPSRFLVGFLKTESHRKLLVPMQEDAWHPEVFALGRRVAYMWCPEGVLASPLGEAVNKALRDSVTMRNWSTVLKLNALAAGIR